LVEIDQTPCDFLDTGEVWTENIQLGEAGSILGQPKGNTKSRKAYDTREGNQSKAKQTGKLAAMRCAIKKGELVL